MARAFLCIEQSFRRQITNFYRHVRSVFCERRGGDIVASKKDLIVAVLATFCLTATLFMIVPTRSQSGSYDARTDVNGDGTIDMADISMGIEGFMATGDPTLNVSVTNWPTSLAVGIASHAVYENVTHVQIPSGFYGEYRCSTRGCESVSIVTEIASVVYPETWIQVFVSFLINGTGGFNVDQYELKQTGWSVPTTHLVSGSELYLVFYNLDYFHTYDVAIYIYMRA